MSDALNENSTAARVVRILAEVAAAEAGVGVRPLARKLELDRSTVGRLLSQLRKLGMVEMGWMPGRYTPGPRFTAIAATVMSGGGIIAMARPVLEELVRQHNETCYLATLENDEVTYRDMVECTHPVRYMVPLGVGSPLHAGAAGRAILAGMSPAEAKQLIARMTLHRLTEQTITSKARLLRIVHADREAGYSVSVGERVPTGAAVAAPVLDDTGQCRGSIVMAFPRERLRDHSPSELGPAVAAAARKMSKLLEVAWAERAQA